MWATVITVARCAELYCVHIGYDCQCRFEALPAQEHTRGNGPGCCWLADNESPKLPSSPRRSNYHGIPQPADVEILNATFEEYVEPREQSTRDFTLFWPTSRRCIPWSVARESAKPFPLRSKPFPLRSKPRSWPSQRETRSADDLYGLSFLSTDLNFQNRSQS